MNTILAFPGASDGKELACDDGDLGSIPGLGRSPGEGHGKPLLVFLPGESLWTEGDMGLQRIGHNWETKNSTEQTLLFIRNTV